MPVFTSGDVMNAAASLLNDSAKSRYTYAVQLPYLNIAMGELQEIFELNNIPVTDTVSTLIEVPAGIVAVGYAPDPIIPNTPYLPDDLIEPKIVWQRTAGIDPYTPVVRVDFLPRYISGTEISQILCYTWQSQEIRFLPANIDIDLKLDYIKSLFVALTDDEGEDDILITNTQSFLNYRTASLCAQFVEENETRAVALDNDAGLALDRSLGIGTKGRQRIIVRHRPFRASYKRRSFQ